MSTENAAHSLLDLPPASALQRTSWVLTLRCKNDQRDHSYDFSDVAPRYPSIVAAFMDAIVGKRHSVGHARRRNMCRAIAHFLAYLDTLQTSPAAVNTFAQIHSGILSNYAAWIRLNKSWSSLTKSYQLGALKPLFDWLRRHHPEAHPDLRVERNLFPMAHRAVQARKPYSVTEWNALLKAIAAEIKASKARLETGYQLQWQGQPPPLEDVAPYDPDKPPHAQHALWESTAYLIWWWENAAQCRRLNDYALRKQVKHASSGLRAIARKCKQGEFGPLEPRKSYLQHFYDWLGPEQSYVPRYLGQPSPIRYRNRFRKPAYLQWYWETHLNASTQPLADLLAAGHYGFIAGVKALYGGLRGFYAAHAIQDKLTYADLLPYILLLAVRTALNFSTIAALRIDCLRPAPSISQPDRDTPAHWMIDWEKLRAHSQGSTIPTHALHDLMPVSVILRVLQITAPYRAGQTRLWISARGDGLISLQAEIAAFIQKHGLTQCDAQGNTQPMRLQLARIRPTIAMREYVRTENMAYIQTLLGHRSMAMTVQYLSQMDNPVLLSRRGVHQEAMFLDLTGNGDIAIQLLEAHGIPAAVGKALADIDSEHHGMLTSCKNPRQSPQQGQTAGQLCTSNACLSCQNLVVTNRDLHKYFCFLRYHDVMLETGRMRRDAYDLATSEVAHVFTTAVLPRFRPETVEHARQQAQLHPLPEWSVELAV